MPSARTSAPTPLGPPILCADNVRRSAPNAAHIKRDFAERLDRIDVQKPARRVNDLGRRRDGLDGAGFVIGQHDRHQRRRAVAKQFVQMIEIDDAGRRHADASRWLVLRKPSAGKHGRMFDCRDDQAARPPAPTRA